MRDDDDDDLEDDGFDDEDDSVEGWIWRLLLLINPGDEATALEQFGDYREAVAQGDEGDPVELVSRVIDWRSGFVVADDDLRSLVDVLAELVARWKLSIDWGGDPDDDDFFADADAGSLLGTAYDCLAESGYTLWVRDGGAGSMTGWITLARDNESMGEVAAALHIDLHPASDVG